MLFSSWWSAVQAAFPAFVHVPGFVGVSVLIGLLALAELIGLCFHE